MHAEGCAGEHSPHALHSLITFTSLSDMFKTSAAPRLSTVLIASGIIVSLAMGVRHGFGFWLQPMSLEHDWTRETFRSPWRYRI